jgi:hypothetical protein
MRPYLIATSLLFSAASAYATPAMLTVSAQANIYGAGQTSAPGGGLLPPSLALKGGVHCIIFTRVKGSLKRVKESPHCSTIEGCISLDVGEREKTHLNDPDGGGGYPASSRNTGANHISGIKAPSAGYLVGLFTRRDGPRGPRPAALDFTTGAGTSFHLGTCPRPDLLRRRQPHR